jgi:hypothetical protein
MEKTRMDLHRRGEVVTMEGMKRWPYIALAIIGVLALVYVYLNRQELGLVRPAGADGGSDASSSARPAVANWKKEDRTAIGFIVDMPAEVKEVQVPAYNERGGSDQVNMIYANPDAETSYSVAWEDNPPVARVTDSSPDYMLDTARDDAVALSQTILVNESHITVAGGFPGRDFQARNVGGGVMNSRLIYASPRLYMLTAAFPSAGARREQDVARFFNSFKIVSPSGIPETMPEASPK